MNKNKILTNIITDKENLLTKQLENFVETNCKYELSDIKKTNEELEVCKKYTNIEKSNNLLACLIGDIITLCSSTRDTKIRQRFDIIKELTGLRQFEIEQAVIKGTMK